MRTVTGLGTTSGTAARCTLRTLAASRTACSFRPNALLSPTIASSRETWGEKGRWMAQWWVYGGVGAFSPVRGCDLEELNLGEVRVPYSLYQCSASRRQQTSSKPTRRTRTLNNTRPSFGGLAYGVHNLGGSHHAVVSLSAHSAPFL